MGYCGCRYQGIGYQKAVAEPVSPKQSNGSFAYAVVQWDAGKVIQEAVQLLEFTLVTAAHNEFHLSDKAYG